MFCRNHRPAKTKYLLPRTDGAASRHAYLFASNNQHGNGPWHHVNSSSARSCGRSAFTPAPGAIPGAWPDANFNFAHIKDLIRKLEAGKFDAFFMADHLAVLNMPVNALKRSHTVTSFEPFTLLSALAAVTEHIGLIATGSTTFDEPYHVARRFASLDHISRRTRRLEYRHHLQSRRGAQFRARRSHGARRALSPRARVL